MSSSAVSAFKKTKRVANTDNNRDHYEETLSSHNVVIPTDIWTEYTLIPAIAPKNVNALVLGDNGTVTQAVTAYFQNTMVAVSGTPYAYSLAALAHSIPYNWDPAGSYQPILYDNAGTNVIPFDMYDLDWAAGVVTFNTLPAPPALPNNLLALGAPKISFYAYTGATGLDAQDVDNLIATITKTAHGFVVGDVIHVDSSGAWNKAAATSVANASNPYFVIEVISANQVKASTIGCHVISSIDFLTTYSATAGTTLYLSETAGALTKVAPLISVPFVRIVSTNEILIWPADVTDNTLNDDDIQVQQATVLAAFKPVRFDDTTDAWVLAQADSEANLATHLVVRANTHPTAPANSWILRHTGIVSGITHGLGADGTKLYLSNVTAGALLSAAPATAIQQHVAQVINATTLLVYFETNDKTKEDNEIAITGAGLAVGDPVYNNGTNWVKASAASLVSAATHVVVRVDPYIATTFYLANSGLYDLGDYTTGPSVTWQTKAGGVAKWLYVGTNSASRTTLYVPDTAIPSIDNRLVYVISGNNVLLYPRTPLDNTTRPAELRISGTLTVGDAYYQNASGVWTLADCTNPATAATHICTRNDPLGGSSYVANNGRVTVEANLNTLHSLTAGSTFYGSETAGDLSLNVSRVNNRLGVVETVGSSSVVVLKSQRPYFVQPEEYVTQTTHGLLLGDGVHLNSATTPIWVRARANNLTTCATHVVTRVVSANVVYLATAGDYDLGAKWDANDTPADATTWEQRAGGKNLPLYLTPDSLAAGPYDTNGNVQAIAGPIRQLLMYTIKDNRVRVAVAQPLDEIKKQSEIIVSQAGAIGWVGQPVYQVNATTWAQAKADSLATAGTHVVTRVHPFNPTTQVMVAASGVHNIGTHGLTIGSLYYVSDVSAGGLVSSEPFRISNPILVPTSTTDVEVLGGPAIDNSRINNEITLTHTNPAPPNQQFAVGKAIYYDAAAAAWKLAYASDIETVATHVITHQGLGSIWYASSHGRFNLGSNPPWLVDANGLPTGVGVETDTWEAAYGANTKLYVNADSTAANQGWLTNSPPRIINEIMTVETGNTVFINAQRVENGKTNPNRVAVTQAGMTVGEAYYLNGGTWTKAQSNSLTTIGTHVVVEADPDATNVFYLIDSGHFTKTAHGLTIGNMVYVSNLTAGLLVDVAPDADQWPRISNPVGLVLDANTIDLFHVNARDISVSGTEEHIGVFAGLSVGDAIYYTGATWARAQANATNTLATHVVTRKQSGNRCYAATSGVYDLGNFETTNTWQTHFGGQNVRVYVSDATYAVSAAATARSLTATAPVYSKQIMVVESGNLVRIDPGQFIDNSLKEHEIRVVAAGLSVGEAVYFTGTTWDQAESTNPLAAPTHMVVRAGETYETANTFYIASTGLHDIGTHGGAAGNTMYAASAGAISATADINKTVVGVATSTTKIALAFGKLEQPFGTRVSQALHGFYDGAPIRYDDTTDKWVIALATSMDNCATHIVTKVETAVIFYYAKSGRFDLGNYDKPGGIEDIVNNSGTSNADTTTWKAELGAIRGDRLYLSATATAPYSTTPVDFYQQLAVLEDDNILHICIGDPLDKVARDTDTYITSALAIEKLVYWDGAAWVVANNTSRDTKASHMIIKDVGGGQKLISAYGEYNVGTHGYTLGDPLYLGLSGDITTTKPADDSDTIIQLIGRATSTTNIMLDIHDIIDQTFETRGRLVTQATHGFDQGDAIYHTGSAWAAALGNRSATLATHVVIKRIDANNFVYASTGRYVFNNFNYLGADDTTWAGQFSAGAVLYTSNSVASDVVSSKPANDSLSNVVMVVESANTVHVIVSQHEDSQKLSINVTQATPTFSVGNVIYYDKTAGRWELAHASPTTLEKSGTHLVYHVDAADNTRFKACASGRVDFGSSVLSSNTPGWWYVSDTTPGLLVSSEPTPVSNPICIAESDQVVHVIPMRAVTSGVTETDAAVAMNVAQTAHGFSVGSVVYRGSSGWVLANANSVATVGTHIVGKVTNANSFVLIASGMYQFVGLDLSAGPISAAVGDWLFLSDSISGQLTKTEGIISNPVGVVEAVGANSSINVRFLRASAKGFTATTVTNDGITITQAGLGLEKAVYLDSADGMWKLADSAAESTLGTHIVIQDLGSNSWIVAATGVATITGHSMGTAGQWFFVGQGTSGGVINTATSNYVNPLGIVIDANTIQLYPAIASQLSQAAAGAGHRWFATVNVTANGGNPDSFGTPVTWTVDDRYTLATAVSNTTHTVPTVAADSVHVGFYSNGTNSITAIIYNNSGDVIHWDVECMPIDGTEASYSVTYPAGFGGINAGGNSGAIDVNIRDLAGVGITNPTDIRINIRRV